MKFEKINKRKLSEYIEAPSEKTVRNLFFSCVLSPLAAFALVLVFWLINTFFFGNMWIFYLFLPFSVLSVLCGKALKKSGGDYKRILYTGVISTILFVCIGSLSFLVKDTYTESDEHVLMVEEIIGMDVSDYSSVKTHRIDRAISNGKVLYVCNAKYKPWSVIELENSMKTEDTWLTYVPDYMLEISSPVFNLEDTDYIMICNLTTGDVNRLPSESGKYDFVSVSYDLSENEMEIVEYRIEFSK